MATYGKWRIKCSTIPSTIPVHQYIFEKTDFITQIKKFKNYFPGDYLKTNLKIDKRVFFRDIKEALDIYGTYPFQYANRQIDRSYLSISLNYNPQSIDKISSNPHLGTLGSTFGSFRSMEKYTNGNLLGKNTYNDTLSFNKRSEITFYKSINTFISNLKRTMIRSRISVLDGQSKSTQDISYGWHSDESIFLNLRINIPIQSSESYLIQILNDEKNISEFTLTPGNAYVYDTSKYHRACTKMTNQESRINLILGISPWFDYYQENDEWISNEFYGEYHPFEMLTNHQISNQIGN